MNYHWTIGQLKSRLNKLENIKKHLNNNKILEDINKDIFNLKLAIEEFDIKNETNLPNKSIIERLEDYKSDFQSIYYILPNLINFYLNLYNPAYEYVPLNKRKLTKDDIYSLTHDFYKDFIGANIYLTFQESFNQRYKHTRFVPRGIYSGQTIYLKSLNETFIESQYENNIFDVIALIHEHGHDIHFRTNFAQQNTDSLDLFSEIISEVMENLAYDYLEKYPEYHDDSIKALGLELTNTYSTLEALYNLINIIITYNEIPNNIKLLKKSCSSNFGLSESEFNFYLKQEYYPEIKYLVGKIIAIELRAIYFKDKDYFIYLLNKIMSLKTLDPLIFYNKLLALKINPLEHINVYSKELKRKLPF